MKYTHINNVKNEPPVRQDDLSLFGTQGCKGGDAENIQNGKIGNNVQNKKRK